MKELDSHLRWWQIELQDEKQMDKFKGWCGSYDSSFKKTIRKHIAQQGHESVLDCGAGLCSEYYGFKSDGYQIRYSGIDATPILVEKCKADGIDIQEGFIDDIKHGDNSFDVCLCLDTLNHQKSFEAPIQEMVRVAKSEVIISFFKGFSKAGGDVSEPKCFLGEDKEDVTLIYSYFDKDKMERFLNGLGVSFTWSDMKERNRQFRHLLYIRKN